jgi:sulfite reductase alpha subunit-like flavoprotein
MAVDVNNALIEVVRTHGRLDQDGAKAYVDRLIQSGRYHRDVY